MVWEAHIDILRCPDCRSRLERPAAGTPDAAVLGCTGCDAVFPVAEGIPILLKAQIRNLDLEQPVLSAVMAQAPAPLRERIARQLAALAATPGPTSWEWEDVMFWDGKYRAQLQDFRNGKVTKDDLRYKERIVQRRPEMAMLSSKDFFPDGIMLEAGSGTALYTEAILANNPEKLYVAVDMSLSGLMLRRAMLQRPHALFVMASIDNLPFAGDLVGALILIGILHHSERKERTMPLLMPMLKARGVVYLDEVVDRPSFWSHRYKHKGVNVSLHEESIDLPSLEGILADGGATVYRVHFHTPFLNFAMQKFVKLAIANRATYAATRFVDKAVQHTLGRVWKTFSGGAISIIWRKA